MSTNSSNSSNSQPPVQGPNVPPPAPGEPSKDPNVDGSWLHNDKGEPTTFFGVRYEDESSEALSAASSLSVGDSIWEPHRRSIGFPLVFLIGSIAAVLWGSNLLNKASQLTALRCFPAIAYEENGEFVLEVKATLPVGETYSVNPNGYEGFGKATVIGSGSGISWLDPEFPADATAGTTSWSVCNK